MILSKDVCIVTIGFYTTHFTGYQPQSQGNTEFCGTFPDGGETIMVLDYLHNSLSEVPGTACLQGVVNLSSSHAAMDDCHHRSGKGVPGE